MKSNGLFSARYIVLEGCEFYCYKSNQKEKVKFYHNIESDIEVIKQEEGVGRSYNVLSLKIGSKYSRDLYFRSVQERN